MDNRDILTLLKKTRFPVCYGAFPTAQTAPYMDLNFLYSRNHFASNVLTVEVNRWQVSLYTLGKKRDQEKRLEKVLTDAGICWEKYSGGIDEEGYLQTIYEFEEVV